MRKKIACSLLAALTVFAAALPRMEAAARNTARIVSVVYDDSGSMNEGGSKNWAYANYAMQAFCALLNKEDQLYITYMSDPQQTHPVDLSGSVQPSVDSIRNHFASSSTPIAAVDTAFLKLASVPSPGAGSEYWLVIITDGQFEYGPNENVAKGEIGRMLTGFSNRKMPNGLAAQLIYLSIGSSADRPDADEGKGIYVYPREASNAVDGSQIVDAISEIADKISQRTRIPEEKVQEPSSTELSFESLLPLLNIAALSQKSSAAIVEATAGGAALAAAKTARLAYPESSRAVTDTSLNGAAFLFANGNKNIPAGTYSFKFSEPVAKGSVVFMYEPAVEIRIKAFKDGKEVADLSALHAGDSIDAEAKVYEIGTDREIPHEELTREARQTLTYLEGGRVAAQSKASILAIKGVTLNDEDCSFKASLEIPGYLPFESAIDFRPKGDAPPPVYSMLATPPQDPSIDRSRLFENAKGGRFSVLKDGEPISRDEAAALSTSFAAKPPYFGRLEVTARLEEDGTFYAVPSYRFLGLPDKWAKLWNWTSSWLVPTGSLVLAGSLDGAQMAEVAISITRETHAAALLHYGAPALFLLYLAGLLFKRRFQRRARVRYIPVEQQGGAFASKNGEWADIQLRKLSLGSFVPFRSERRRAMGLSFNALPQGMIGVRKRQVGPASMRLSAEGFSLEEEVRLEAAKLPESFVGQGGTEKSGFVAFGYGEALLDTKNGEAGTLFWFDKRRRMPKKEA
jgi:hypothetical protein